MTSFRPSELAAIRMTEFIMEEGGLESVIMIVGALVALIDNVRTGKGVRNLVTRRCLEVFSGTVINVMWSFTSSSTSRIIWRSHRRS